MNTDRILPSRKQSPNLAQKQLPGELIHLDPESKRLTASTGRQLPFGKIRRPHIPQRSAIVIQLGKKRVDTAIAFLHNLPMPTTVTRPLRQNLSGLIEKELAGELMLFDPLTKKTRCLNRTAAIVWRHADGVTSTEQLAHIVAEETGTPVDIRVVEYALRKLDEEGLMEFVGQPSTEEANLGRRQLFAKLGWAAALLVAIPVITTVTAPKAYAASFQLE